MAAARLEAGYTRLNIALHWAIAALVILQFVSSDQMEELWRATRRGEAAPDPAVAYALHVVPGILIFVLTLVRLWDQRTRSRGIYPPEEPAVLTLLARITHALLWTLLIVMPILGMAAWFLRQDWAADVHEALRIPLMILIGLHVAGALYQHFILRTDVLKRIVKPAAP